MAVWANEIIRKGFSTQTEIYLYNADVIAICANEIGALQIPNRYEVAFYGFLSLNKK